MSTEPTKPRSLYEELLGSDEHEKHVAKEKTDLADLKKSFAEDDTKKS